MERTTIMLPTSLKARLQRCASYMGISLGQYIREAVENSLELRKAALSIEEDPFFADNVVYEGEVPSDTSENHDRYLYGGTE